MFNEKPQPTSVVGTWWQNESSDINETKFIMLLQKFSSTFTQYTMNSLYNMTFDLWNSLVHEKNPHVEKKDRE